MTTTAPTTQVDGAHARSIRLFDHHGVDIEVEPGEATPDELLRRATRERGCLWVDLIDPDANTLAPWAQALDLHPLAVDEAATGDQQPTVQGFGDQLFVVVWASPDYARTTGAAIPKLFMFLGDRFVLTVQRDASARTFDLERRFTSAPQYLRDGGAGVLYIVLSTLVNHYNRILGMVEKELAELESEVFDEQAVDDATRLYRLRQHLGKLERPLSSLTGSLSRTPDSLTRLVGRHRDLAPYLTDAIDDLMGLGGLVHEQRASLDTIVASHENNVAQQQNADMRRISAYGALLAVPTVIAGLYGMNFKHLPGTAWEWGWLAVLATVVAIDVLIVAVFRRRKWL